MSRKAKRTTQFWLDDEWIICNELPEGYFYKNKFYTENKVFDALLKDDEVSIHHFLNGTWIYKGILYSSLKELYEWSIDGEDDVSYKYLKYHYENYGIEHNSIPCTLYSYDRDDERRLFDTKGEVLSELRCEEELIEDVEDREERYLENKSKAECIVYFKKPIKEKIKILEKML